MVMPGEMDGLAALAAFKKIDRDVPIIVLSGQGRTTTVVQAMKLGASDFVSKPFEETTSKCR
jgi:DNA-binding NtrC family response regulator